MTVRALRQLRVVCRTSLDAMLGLDDDRRIVDLNDRAGLLLAVDRETATGLGIDDFCPPERRGRLQCAWNELERAGQHSGRLRLLRAFASGLHLVAARAIAGEPKRRGVLTPREREVLQLAADGHRAPQIAERLYLSPGTVKTHFQNIYAKMGVGDRASAVASALRSGLIE
jgi:DNA-binding NarL/FixJ family response regulator